MASPSKRRVRVQPSHRTMYGIFGPEKWWDIIIPGSLQGHVATINNLPDAHTFAGIYAHSLRVREAKDRKVDHE